MDKVDPRYFNWGERFQEGAEQSRQRRLQDIALGNEQMDRGRLEEDRQLSRRIKLQELAKGEDETRITKEELRRKKLLNMSSGLVRSFEIKQKTGNAAPLEGFWAAIRPELANDFGQDPGEWNDENIKLAYQILAQSGGDMGQGDASARGRQIVRLEDEKGQIGMYRVNPDTGDKDFIGKAPGEGTQNLRSISIGGKQYDYNPRTGEYTPANVGGGGPRSKDPFEDENKLRDEVNALGVDYRKVKDAYGRVKAAAGTADAAGDLALIFNFMKMLDPGSVVREGEFATAQNATGVDERVVNLYNRVLRGERLNPQQRTEFVKQSEAQLESATKSYQERVKPYREISKKYGLDVENVDVTGVAPASDQLSDDDLINKYLR